MLKFQSVFKLLTFCLSLLILSSCGESQFEYSVETKLNPHNLSPLTAALNITAEKPCKASVTVLGASPVTHSVDVASKNLEIPVLGLYPDAINKIALTLDYDGGQVLDTILIETKPLPILFPTIEINKLERSKMETGWHACDIHFANNGTFRSMPIIFDDQGVVRWYLDLSFHGKMVAPFQRLKDGTILMVGRQTVYEFNMLGKLTRRSKIDSNYGMHHDVLELPNGNLLVCVGKRNAYIELNGEQVLSDSDFIILLDRKTNKILKEWDLAKHLDVSRNDLNFFRPGDWLHMNGLAFVEKDSSIIVSGKNQGLVKISWDDELKWILAPNKNWGVSGRTGNGYSLNPYLLTAINSEGIPYPMPVQNGTKSVNDFDFPWGPHAPKLLPNGNILVFDNGAYRNFNADLTYSRAVEYKVDDSNKTVEQIWQYGKERGRAYFSTWK